MKLYKTTIVIWSPADEDPGEKELPTLAQDATDGTCYCSRCRSELIEDAKGDPDWDNTEFFDGDSALDDEVGIDDDADEV